MARPRFAVAAGVGGRLTLAVKGIQARSAQTCPWSPQKIAYTVEEAAELLSISRAQTYRLIETGELGSFKIGKCRRVSAEQLVEFVAR